MRVSHTAGVASIRRADFDDEHLIAHAGVAPVMELAAKAGLPDLAWQRLTVASDKGSNPAGKTMAMVAGLVMGADWFDDMEVLRSGAMDEVIGFGYAPSTLGQSARKFTFGHVRQMDAVAARLTVNLAGMTGLLGSPAAGSAVMVDVDDTLVEVSGRAKQGAGIGYTNYAGLVVMPGVSALPLAGSFFTAAGPA